MPGELLLINPRRRRRKTRRTHARRNPRRRRRMSALQRRYFGKRRHVTHAARNPRRKRRYRVRSAARLARYRVRRARRNPMPRVSFNGLTKMLVGGTVGAAGAMGVDILLGYANQSNIIPTSLQSGVMNSVLRLGAAVGLGYLAEAVGGKNIGEEVAAGAIVVTLYDLLKPYVQQAGVPMAGLRGGLRAYMPRRMGYYSAARVVG